jgi:hypothetical protein
MLIICVSKHYFQFYYLFAGSPAGFAAGSSGGLKTCSAAGLERSSSLTSFNLSPTAHQMNPPKIGINITPTEVAP